MPFPQFMTHTGVANGIYALTADQQAVLEADGWVTDTPPGGFEDPDFRRLWTIDIGDLVPPLVGGLVPAEYLPSIGGGLTEAGVAAMWSTEPSVSYNSTTKKLTLTISGGGLNTEAVQDAVAAMAVQSNGVTITYDDTANTLTFAIDLEYLQDQVAAMFNGAHTNATVTYDDTTGKLTIAASGGGTPGTDSITRAMLQDHVVGAAEVVAAEIPVFNVEGAVPLADGVSRDAGTGASHGDVDDLAATIVALIFDQFTAGSMLVANTAGTPVALTGTGDWAPARVGGTWVARDLSLFGGTSSASGTLIRQTLWDPYLNNARKLSAAIADAIAPASGFVPTPGTHPAANIGIYGDSVTEVQAGVWVDRLRRRAARFNSGALPPGWVNGSTATNPLQGFRFVLTTTGSPLGGDNTTVARGLARYCYALAPGAELTLQDFSGVTATAVFDWAKFLYSATRTNGTTLSITIDGSVVGTVSTGDGTVAASPGYDSGRTALTWTGTLTSHTTIKVANTGSQIGYFDGVYLGDQRERVRIWNGGRSGTKYSDYLSATNPGPLQTAKNLDFDCIFAAWGINDYGDGTTLFGTNVAQWWTDVRAVLPDVSCGGLITYPTQTRANWQDFATVQKQKYAAALVPVVDTSWMIGPGGAGAAGADPRDLVENSLNVHELAAGGELWAREVSRFLFGDDIDWYRQIDNVTRNGLSFPQIGPPAGVANTAIAHARASGGATQWGIAMPDGTYRAVASSSFTDSDIDSTYALRPTGAIASTFPRHIAGTANLASVLTSGQLFMVAIDLHEGMTVTNITFVPGTSAAVSPTHWWFSLHTGGRAVLGQTADQTTTVPTAATSTTATPVTLALSGPYSVLFSGRYYLGIMMTAATPMSLMGVAGNAGIYNIAPILNGNSASTGLTTPGTLTSPAGVITAGGSRPYAYVS